jgi:hypothetical protein
LQHRRRVARGAFAATAFVAALYAARPAAAAEPWVERPITLPRHVWSFDAGFALAHGPEPLLPTGGGFNFDFAVGVTQHLELGFRSGVRFGLSRIDGRLVEADQYARLYDRETFGTGVTTLANPELRIRGSLVHFRVFELALEGRATLPFEDNTRPGLEFGVPMAFHFGHFVRLDTGVYVPVVFFDPIESAVSIPVQVWFQATRGLFLGPITGANLHGRPLDAAIPLGFGLGYQFTNWLDLKTMVLFPNINEGDGIHQWALAAGLQFRIE